MEIKQQLKLSQQLVMTPQLQQAIKLLQLSRLELIDEIRKELDGNPVLAEEEGGERPNAPPAPPTEGNGQTAEVNEAHLGVMERFSEQSRADEIARADQEKKVQ